MKLPLSIKPCPIIASVIELRFIATEPDDAIFGILHKEIKNQFPKIEKLPILSLPEQLRNSQENLKFKPYYRFSDNHYEVNIGPRVISIIKKEPYDGWENFSQKARDIFNILHELELVNKIVRLGLRYTNFFEQNIYEKVDLKLSSGSENFIKDDTYIKNAYKKEAYNIILQLGNNSTLTKVNEDIKGSILDIDVHSGTLENIFLKNPDDILNEMHQIEKETFFGLLKDEFIEQLDPQYQ